MAADRPLNDLPCGGKPSGLANGALRASGAAATRFGAVLVTLRRFGPLAIVAAVLLLLVAMGWQRQITLENIVTARDRFHEMLAEHAVVAVLIYVAVYVCMASLCLPGAPILTATGGL